MSAEADAFLRADVLFEDVGTAEIAYRKFPGEGGRGAALPSSPAVEGSPLLLVHGWPLSGFTFRKLLPRLAARHTCYAIDLPGAGATRWREGNDFTFSGQARNVVRFLEKLGLERVRVVAHDTGATIAREVALQAGARVERLVLINTEIPGHRPPWIPLYQWLVRLPGANASFRLLLRSRMFVSSPLGFGNCFADRRLLGGEFEEQFLRPMIEDARRMEGQMRYLVGIDWRLVDGLAARHAQIAGPVLLVWGADDPTFPIERARAMIPQFKSCAGLRAVPGAKLLVHEERPEAVGDHILEFFGEGESAGPASLPGQP